MFVCLLLLVCIVIGCFCWIVIFIRLLILGFPFDCWCLFTYVWSDLCVWTGWLFVMLDCLFADCWLFNCVVVCWFILASLLIMLIVLRV